MSDEDDNEKLRLELEKLCKRCGRMPQADHVCDPREAAFFSVTQISPKTLNKKLKK